MNGVKNMMSMFDAEKRNTEFLEVQMEQLQNADTRDNCLATLERMNVETEDFEPELTQEQSDMVELLDDLGMTMEATEFIEECNGNCSGGKKSVVKEKDTKEDEEVEESGITKARNKVLSTGYDIADGIDDVIDKSPLGPPRKKISQAINPLGYDQGQSNKKEREQLRKKKKSIWSTKECNESTIAQIPDGSVSEVNNFFKLTQNGLTSANEAAINDRIALLDRIIGTESNPPTAIEAFDPNFDLGMDDLLMEL